MATTTEQGYQPKPAEPGTPPDGGTAVVDTQALARPGATVAMARAGTMQAVFAGLMPTSIGELVVLSGHLAKSEAIPKSMRGKPDTVFSVCWAGLELGLTPIRSVQSITNISGTLCMKADLQLALVKGRAVLAFYDEGYEEAGRTDGNLAKRIDLALGRALRKANWDDQDVADAVDLAIEKIAAATNGLPNMKPYGWAIGIRLGDPTVHVRTFTWADAERAEIWSDEEPQGGQRKKSKLSEKFNYISFPGDMYPKRARTRLLQVLASDVTNGLPSVEAMEGGQIIDAEFTVSHGDGDDIDTLLAQVRDQDADVATTIEAGFTQLKLGKAAQLQKLTQFRGKPKDLVDWLKTEYANRKGVDRNRPDVLGGGTQAAATAQPAVQTTPQPGHQPATTTQPAAIQGEVIDAEVPDEDLAADPGVQAAMADIERAAAERKAAEQPMTPTKDLAERFRQKSGPRKPGLKTF